MTMRIWILSCISLAGAACGTDTPAGPMMEEDGVMAYPFATGPEMLPGDNCRACHGAPSSPYPDALDWSFAGTVFTGPDSDVGEPGVTVTVRDATGAEVTAVSNEVGNFFSLTPLVAPYSVSMQKGERSVSMAVFPPAGGCNACHAKNPVGGAPGRLYLPDGEFESAAECDGDHTVWIDDFTYDCAPYRCTSDANACASACASDEECVAGASCVDGLCRAD